MEALRLRQTKTGEERRLDVDGVFIAVGIAPESELYAGQLELDEQGYIRRMRAVRRAFRAYLQPEMSGPRRCARF